MLQKLAVLIIIITLSGCCGFKLRGAHTIPAELKTIHLTPNEPYDPFQRALRSRLKTYDIQILSNPKKDVARLQVSKAAFSEEVLAYGSSAQVQRYKLIIIVNYTLSTKNDKCTRTITRSRELSKSTNLMLSNESEEQIIKRELIEESVNELLRQITSRPPCNATMQHSSSDSPC